MAGVAWRQGFVNIGAALLGGLNAAFGTLTSTDILRQLGNNAGGVPSCSAEIDLVADVGQFFQLIPAMPRRLASLTPTVWITAVGGTRSVAPNVSLGTNANANDYLNNQPLNAGILTQAANTRTLFGTAVSPTPILDLTTNGLRFKLESALTGITPIAKIRVVISAVVF